VGRRSMRAAVCVFVSGAGVGLMTGLSISPVVGTILASVMAVVITLASVLAGLEVTPGIEAAQAGGSRRRDRIRLDPLPVAVLVVGLTAGAIGGATLRARNVLGMGPPSEQSRLGLLFRNEVSVCNDLRATPPDTLAAAVREATKQESHLLAIVNECGSTDCLRAIVEVLCETR
jgi:hypothetical protein